MPWWLELDEKARPCNSSNNCITDNTHYNTTAGYTIAYTSYNYPTANYP